MCNWSGNARFLGPTGRTSFRPRSANRPQLLRAPMAHLSPDKRRASLKRTKDGPHPGSGRSPWKLTKARLTDLVGWPRSQTLAVTTHCNGKWVRSQEQQFVENSACKCNRSRVSCVPVAAAPLICARPPARGTGARAQHGERASFGCRQDRDSRLPL
jgi:hypothetical protein